MAEDATLVDIEYTGIGGMRFGVLDLLALAAFGTEAVERELPSDVGLEVGGRAARAQDQVFVSGPF